MTSIRKSKNKRKKAMKAFEEVGALFLKVWTNGLSKMQLPDWSGKYGDKK